MIGETIGAGALRLALIARRKKLDPRKTRLPVETVSIDSASGARLAGWFLRGEPGRGAVLLLHGITDNRMKMVERMRFLSREGFATLAIDFQAHGMSEGRFITVGARESFDARAAAQWLRARLPEREDRRHRDFARRRGGADRRRADARRSAGARIRLSRHFSRRAEPLSFLPRPARRAVYPRGAAVRRDRARREA